MESAVEGTSATQAESAVEQALPQIYRNQKEAVSEIEKALRKPPIVPSKGKLLMLLDNFQYKGVLIVPKTAERKTTTGVIIAINPDDEADNNHIVGTRVLVAMYSGTLVKFQEIPAYQIISYEEILGFPAPWVGELEGSVT